MNFQDLILTPKIYGQNKDASDATYDMEMVQELSILNFFWCFRWKTGFCGLHTSLRRPKDGKYGENPNRCNIIFNFKLL
jgi:glycyl-tRNA synthetase alpha subunit